eukprot:CAMPEP_0168335616 /NCGR_PEP_ID=MMETSP0213-20121227/11020_1 /TAXON_ID=151035 /ORGANISM="Euplotes harpa, Strain FSP1.4" /LENGTH=183 /DNA_ID=CAMNT_0008340587 /DNA_START=126 /DNA_END=677 /DNA_ORIENTATION=-
MNDLVIRISSEPVRRNDILDIDCEVNVLLFNCPGESAVSLSFSLSRAIRSAGMFRPLGPKLVRYGELRVLQKELNALLSLLEYPLAALGRDQNFGTALVNVVDLHLLLSSKLGVLVKHGLLIARFLLIADSHRRRAENEVDLGRAHRQEVKLDGLQWLLVKEPVRRAFFEERQGLVSRRWHEV